MSINVFPQCPLAANNEAITAVISGVLGDGLGGVYAFTADAAMGASDPATYTVWIVFSQGGSTAVVAATDAWPIFVRGAPQYFVLPVGVKWKAITSTNATTLIWSRVSHE
jgi:hypothetical protein